MGKTLVITEKPSVVQDLAKTVDPTARRGNGCLEGSGYTFTWALGHLGELAGPEEWEPGLKGRWRLDLLPVIPERPKLRAVSGKKEQLATVKRLLRDADHVVVAPEGRRAGGGAHRRGAGRRRSSLAGQRQSPNGARPVPGC
ncbi:MAG: toprim domain-containing protein [Thermaerobacter sp.]|nr:toprim domain-containing protein [Thermaerobacter sp.]